MSCIQATSSAIEAHTCLARAHRLHRPPRTATRRPAQGRGRAWPAAASGRAGGRTRRACAAKARGPARIHAQALSPECARSRRTCSAGKPVRMQERDSEQFKFMWHATELAQHVLAALPVLTCRASSASNGHARSEQAPAHAAWAGAGTMRKLWRSPPVLECSVAGERLSARAWQDSMLGALPAAARAPAAGSAHAPTYSANPLLHMPENRAFLLGWHTGRRMPGEQRRCGAAAGALGQRPRWRSQAAHALGALCARTHRMSMRQAAADGMAHAAAAARADASSYNYF